MSKVFKSFVLFVFSGRRSLRLVPSDLLNSVEPIYFLDGSIYLSIHQIGELPLVVIDPTCILTYLKGVVWGEGFCFFIPSIPLSPLQLLALSLIFNY